VGGSGWVGGCGGGGGGYKDGCKVAVGFLRVVYLFCFTYLQNTVNNKIYSTVFTASHVF
jgi:hypothetical protein